MFRRLRGVKAGESKYELNFDSLQLSEHSVEADLINAEAGVKFKFLLSAIVGNTFRIFVDENSSLHKRYRVEGVLDGEPQVAR